MPTSSTSVNPCTAIAQLASCYQNFSLMQAFSHDTQRALRYRQKACGILLDYSKNYLDDTVLSTLCKLLEQINFTEKRDAMFRGEAINDTENRAVLHTALRAKANSIISCRGENVVALVHHELARLYQFAHALRCGQWRGFDGRVIKHIVNLGIGGSDLGPQMVCEALKAQADKRFTMHFISSLDGEALNTLLAQLDPATTLFIVASKTFTTQETLSNARSARTWLNSFLSDPTAIAQHFVAVSANEAAVYAFGINTCFNFWDWVGGRYSLWSAIGLPIILQQGQEQFDALLAGARAMDEHFCEAPAAQNMPVLLALIGLWYINGFNRNSLLISPYNQALHRLPAYLQQLEMESNGKSVNHQGQPLTHATCPVIWGEPGINGQHAYYQLLHQGPQFIPIDFIAAINNPANSREQQCSLLAHCLAQAEALMRGKSLSEVKAELSASQTQQHAAHRLFSGNRPSNILLLDRLDAKHLGSLLALYEHKVFVQGVLWNINSFDQWGVALGKALASKITLELTTPDELPQHDASTNQLISYIRDIMMFSR